jgi:hypothetical protein
MRPAVEMSKSGLTWRHERIPSVAIAMSRHVTFRIEMRAIV